MSTAWGLTSGPNAAKEQHTNRGLGSGLLRQAQGEGPSDSASCEHWQHKLGSGKVLGAIQDLLVRHRHSRILCRNLPHSHQVPSAVLLRHVRTHSTTYFTSPGRMSPSGIHSACPKGSAAPAEILRYIEVQAHPYSDIKILRAWTAWSFPDLCRHFTSNFIAIIRMLAIFSSIIVLGTLLLVIRLRILFIHGLLHMHHRHNLGQCRASSLQFSIQTSLTAIYHVSPSCPCSSELCLRRQPLQRAS